MRRYEETLHQEIERLQKREKALQEQLRVTKEESHKALKAAEQNLKHKTAEMGRILHRHIKNSLAQDVCRLTIALVAAVVGHCAYLPCLISFLELCLLSLHSSRQKTTKIPTP